MNSDRLYGLSILRIISMLGIVGLHILNAGGAFGRENLISMIELPISILYIFCAASVNTFAMLTGYLYVDKPNVKYKNILKLIFTVLFYSAIITILFIVFKRETFNSIVDIIKSFVPPLANKYWYITCYLLLFVLIPFINKLIDSLTLYQFKLLLILLLIFTSILPTFLLTDFFKLDGGYSTAWLIVCYLIGAYIKRSKQRFSTYTILTLYLLCVIATISISAIAWLLLKTFSIYNILVTYTSPFIVLISILSILLFSKITVKNIILIKTINILSNCAFDVYIIHSHLLIFAWFINDNFAFIKTLDSYMVVPVILISMIIIYMICWMISLLKLFIFKITRLDFIFDKLGHSFDLLLENFSNKQVDSNTK